MSYFKAKMHQIRFRLRLCPRPRWGANSAPQPLAGFKGPTSKGTGGKGGEGKGEEGRTREGRGGAGMERGREGRERKKGREGIGEGEGGNENGHRPHTIFGLKVALINSQVRHGSSHHSIVYYIVYISDRKKRATIGTATKTTQRKTHDCDVTVTEQASCLLIAEKVTEQMK